MFIGSSSSATVASWFVVATSFDWAEVSDFMASSLLFELASTNCSEGETGSTGEATWFRLGDHRKNATAAAIQPNRSTEINTFGRIKLPHVSYEFSFAWQAARPQTKKTRQGVNPCLG